MFQRLWVWIPAPYTGWTFFHIPICCKLCNVCLKKTKIKEKEAGVGPFFQKNYLTSIFHLGKARLVMKMEPSDLFVLLKRQINFFKFGHSRSPFSSFSSSVTRMGSYWKVLATNFVTKVVKIFTYFLDIFKNIPFQRLLFGQLLGEIVLLFNLSSGHTVFVIRT